MPRRASILCFALSGLICWSPTVSGVVINRSDGTGNTTAPGDDPGFANVGERGVGTAAYLGNRWVLTAAHLGTGTVTFQDQQYEPTESVRIDNPSGMTPQTDLLLLRLPEAPDLPSLRLPCGARQLGSNFTMIGHGHDRNPQASFWKVDVKPGANDDVWTAVDSAAESDRQGFGTLTTQSIRWGIGSTSLTDLVTETDQGDVMSFTSSFNQNLETEDLAQAVRGDSGGATFQKNLGVWELIGIVFAVDVFENQPDSTRSAIYGNSTFIADLFRYSKQLRAVADFEPDAGDLNGDGKIDASEIDAMQLFKYLGEFGSCHFDVDANGTVNSDDFEALLVSAGTLIGDTDLDGAVGFSDFLTMSKSFGTDVAGWENGDFDGDGKVSFGDFLGLSGNFGDSFSATGDGPLVTFVPEPLMDAWTVVLAWLLLTRTKPRINGSRKLDYGS